MTTQRIGGKNIYGTGSDGNVVISANTSLSRDMYYYNLTINSGYTLFTNGFKIFVKNNLNLNGNIVCNSGSTSGTLSGSESLNAGNIIYALGGNSASNTFTASQLSDSYKKDINVLISGVVPDTSGQFIRIKGGASGANGANAVVTPATSGSPGTLDRFAGVPGGPGISGSNAIAGVPGNGGVGGGLILICAKNIVRDILYSPYIKVLGGNATLGTAGSNGSNGSSALTAYVTHLTDGTASYITGNGISGPTANLVVPNVPHGGHVPSVENKLVGYTYRYVHRGHIHHTYSDWLSSTRHDDHGFNYRSPYGHHYGNVDNTSHVDTLTSTYFSINSIPHTTPHRNHTGVAYTSNYSATGGSYGTTNGHEHGVYQYYYKSLLVTNHESWPVQHHDNDHAHYRKREAGTVSTQGNIAYPGGNGGSAGTTTAGGNGISGGGGGIIIITDSLATGITTDTSGGSISGNLAGSSGSVVTIINN